MGAAESAIGSWMGNITPEQITAIDDICLDNMHIPKDKLSARSRATFERTREAAFESFECKGIYQGFPVERIDEHEIVLCNGTILPSETLAQALAGSIEVVAFIVVAHGFEALAFDQKCSSVESMFLSGWGVGFSSGGHRWLEGVVRDRAHEAGLYMGKSWLPGENNVSMDLQKQLFELIEPERIGIELQDGYTMRPVMSVGGFIGISDDEAIEEQKTVLMV